MAGKKKDYLVCSNKCLFKVVEAGMKNQTKPDDKTDSKLRMQDPEALVFLAVLIPSKL